MPIYEYECKIHGFTYDITHKVDERPEVICGFCKRQMEKVISPSTIVFKGDGWETNE